MVNQDYIENIQIEHDIDFQQPIKLPYYFEKRQEIKLQVINTDAEGN